jgi:hypothetical protein
MPYTSPKRGAIPSPRSALAAAIPYAAGGVGAPPNFIVIPQQLSTWGNTQYGDCVTAEEAFAKACYNPEIFISDQEVINWATQHNVLEGAYLNQVLAWMQTAGFQQNGQIYNDGSHYTVNWTNLSVLQNAISKGPVKIGVAADQLEGVWTDGQNGWFATGFHQDSAEDHCVSLCGYGTLNWLAQQLQVTVPSGVDGTKQGYALFTWGTIGIIDVPSMVAITHEAWLRQPTTIIKRQSSAPPRPPGAQELRALIDQSLAAGMPGAVGGPSPAADFCTVWPTARPVLQFLASVIGLIPGAGTGAGVALNALITAGQAVYDQTCGSGR